MYISYISIPSTSNYLSISSLFLTLQVGKIDLEKGEYRNRLGQVVKNPKRAKKLQKLRAIKKRVVAKQQRRSAPIAIRHRVKK